MKCPKCNYISFDYLDSCKKCGKDLTEHKEKHNIRSVLFAGTGAAAVGVAAAADGDFTFDFNEEEQPVNAPAEESPVAAAEPEPSEDPFAVGESSDDFSFDSNDDFSFDDDEL